MTINSLIKTVSLFMTLGLLLLLLDPSLKLSCLSLLSSWDYRHDTTRCLSRCENSTETCHLWLSWESPFSVLTWQTPTVLFSSSYPYCIWCTSLRLLWQPGFQEAGISQMKLSDTGYLSLWFWMNSAWRTAAAQQLCSSCPTCLSQNTPHSFF